MIVHVGSRRDRDFPVIERDDWAGLFTPSADKRREISIVRWFVVPAIFVYARWNGNFREISMTR